MAEYNYFSVTIIFLLVNNSHSLLSWCFENLAQRNCLLGSTTAIIDNNREAIYQ